MDFTVGKAGAKAATNGIASPEGVKGGARSKFDSIRSDLAAQLAAQITPPEASPVTAAKKTALENDLRQRLQQGGSQAVMSDFHQQSDGAAARIQELKHAVAKLPEADAFAPVRNRLQALEAEYMKSGDMIKAAQGSGDPKRLLGVQLQLYGMSQNLEIMSRVVDQLSSGIKTVLDTHVG